MKIVSFNINGLRARPHQIEELVKSQSPDIIGLQEIKVHDEMFPHEIPKSVGYHAYYYGQKSHYGVAIFSKEEAVNVEYGFPNDDDDSQRRMIIATFNTDNGPLKVINGYFPQGENVIVMGDINISPTDLDIGIGPQNAKRWLKSGKCSFQPIEREWYTKLENWGLTDTYRQLNPEKSDRYSWFDYRSKGFADEPKRGLRIDVIMATKPLLGLLQDADVDYDLRAMEKPSDHAPIWTDFDLKVLAK